VTLRTALISRSRAGIHRQVSHLMDALAVQDDSFFVVSTQGSDTYGNGTFNAPYLTLTKALSLVSTTRKTIYVFPGDYAETVSLTWPNVNEVHICGLGGIGSVVISGPITTPVITIDPTYTAAGSFEAFLENVCVKHTAQTAIEINNANITTKKLLVHLIGVEDEQVSTGDAVNVTHATAGQAIRIYAKHCNFEGLVDFVVAKVLDRLGIAHDLAVCWPGAK
jgi:hypothetical protein